MIFQSDNQSYYGPVPWWVLTGTLTRSEITRQLDEMLERNIREVFLYANYGLEKPDFLSEEWFECIEFMIGEFAKRNMAFWIYDDLSWPSGSAGGIVPRDYPQYRMRSLNRFEHTLAPGESLSLPVGDMVRWCGFFPPESDTPQTLTPGSRFCNSFDCDVTVTILEVKLVDSIFFHNIGTESTWNQIGTLDTLNPAAVKCWMSYIHEEYRKRFKKYFGTVIKGFFFDEPTMSALDKTNTVPWTWDLEEAFAERYNYDCAENYWKLFYQKPDCEQFRYDFWLLTGNRFAEAFAKQLGDWCAENDLMLTGHGWPEEPSCQRLMINATGDLHFQQQYLQVPGTDILQSANCFTENITMGDGVKGWARNYIYSTKHPASTARYNNTKRTLVENSMICNFNSPLSQQRWCFDYHFSMGLNMMNSAVAFSLRDFRKYACCAESAMPYWRYYRGLSDYMERSSYFHTRGYQATEIAVLNAVSAKFAASDIAFDTSMRNEKTPFPPGCDSAEATLKTLDALIRLHRDFELLFEEVLVKGTIENGKLKLPNSEFSVIIIPQALTLADDVAAKLAEFTASGGTVIAVGDVPQKLVHSANGSFCNDLNNIASCRIAYEQNDFPEQLAALLEKASPVLYTLSGEKSDEVITLLRQDNDWYGLWLYNATDRDKSLTLATTPKLGKARAVFDPGDGICYQAPADGKFVLQSGQSLAFLFDKSIQEQLPAFELAPWNKLVCSHPLPLEWHFSKVVNTMRPDLELLLNGEFIAIPSDGYCPVAFNPDTTPFVTIRGKFVIKGNVPDDLRLRFDSQNFAELSVNGVSVKQTAVPEKVFDASNCAVYISNYCQTGENTFTVQIPISRWFGDRYGINMHFKGLMKLLDIVPLAGSFALNSERELVSLPEKFTAGDLCQQGLPEFFGTLELNTTFDLPANGLSASRILGCSACSNTIALRLNNVDLPPRLWQYGNFELPENLLKSSDNTLELTITQPAGNLYTRRWNGGKLKLMDFVLPEFYF
ncbi:MAG: hypothetical protein E7039_06930 [Lentisphaerae bacterium]|nr:hypothetical protein [Lentisphaerota bacterium]